MTHSPSARIAKVLSTAFFVAISVALASAQLPGTEPTSTGSMNGKLPPILTNVGVDQRLGAQVPLDLPFRDENGRTVTLKDYMHDGRRPAVLSLVYYSCPMLCPEVLNGMSSSLREVTLDPGKDYQIITLSFDPKDTSAMAASEKKEWVPRLGRAGADDAWHFLTGDQSSIKQLTDAVGFRYQWDPASQQFAHATALVLLTPDGKVSKYFYGVDFTPRDLRFGLVEASRDKIGSLVDPILLFCCQYNATTGRYDMIVGRVLALGGGFTLLVLGAILIFLVRHDPNRGTKQRAAESVTGH